MPTETVYATPEKVGKQYLGGGLEPPKFMPSFYEWLFSRGEQICFNASGSTLTTYFTLVDIPINCTLYITSVAVSGISTGVGEAWINVRIMDNGTNGYLISVWNDPSILSLHKSMIFTIPIKAKSGIVQCRMTNNIKVFGNLTGFIVKNSDIPSF